MRDVMIVRPPRWRGIWIGVSYAAVALLALGIPLAIIILTDPMFLVSWIGFALVATVAVFLGVALRGFGFVRRNPVILRLDEVGVSGYFVPDLPWVDVVRVGFHSYRSRHNLGFELRDVTAYRLRQDLLMRIKMAFLPKKPGDLHLLVPGAWFDQPFEQVLERAQQLHARAIADQSSN